MSDMTELVRRNGKLLYLNSFLENSYYIDAIYVLFGTHYLHLSFFQAGSLFFVGWFASLLFDFLGGVVADVIGRKRTQLLGLAIQALSFAPYLFTKSYVVLLIASSIWGIGLALSSNTLHALMYEQAEESGNVKSYQHINAIAQVWLFVGLASAALIGGFAYHIDPRLPYLLLIVTILLSFFVTTRIKVQKQVEVTIAEKHKSKNIVKTAVNTFRENRKLKYYVAISFFGGLWGDMLFSYYQPYYIKLGVGAATLGIVFALVRLFSGCGSYLMRKLPDVLSLSSIQLLYIAAMAVTACMLLVFHLPVVLFAPLIVAVGAGFIEPGMRLFVNQNASNFARTSALSFGNTIMNLGVGIGFVVAFWMADHFSSETVLKVILLGTVATLAFGLFTLRLGDNPK